MLAYVLSLLFTLAYGYWAAKDHIAEKVLIPLLDILQSIPVLGFMPGLVLALVAIFPNNNVGLELACVIMIFTGQVWNMTFSFYQSLRSIPQYLLEAASVYRFNWFAEGRQAGDPLFRHRPHLEQHDEHGRRLVFPDGHRGLPTGRQGLPPARVGFLHERGQRQGRQLWPGSAVSWP